MVMFITAMRPPPTLLYQFSVFLKLCMAVTRQQELMGTDKKWEELNVLEMEFLGVVVVGAGW